jgi:superoxide dismutase
MRVYIPFDDGSVVSYDGRKFTIHKRPVDIDADLSALSEGTAAQMWRERRKELVKALESAWWKEHTRRREKETKELYSKEPKKKAVEDG